MIVEDKKKMVHLLNLTLTIFIGGKYQKNLISNTTNLHTMTPTFVQDVI